MYDGIPVITDDCVSDAQTQGAATTCSSISAVRFGMEGGGRWELSPLNAGRIVVPNLTDNQLRVVYAP